MIAPPWAVQPGNRESAAICRNNGLKDAIGRNADLDTLTGARKKPG